MREFTNFEAVTTAAILTFVGYKMGEIFHKKADLPEFCKYDIECYNQIRDNYISHISPIIPEQWATETKVQKRVLFFSKQTIHPTHELDNLDLRIRDNQSNAHKLNNSSHLGKMKASILNDIVSIFQTYKNNQDRTSSYYYERNDGPQMMMWSEFIQWLLTTQFEIPMGLEVAKELDGRIEFFRDLQTSKYSEQSNNTHNTTIHIIKQVFKKLTNIKNYIIATQESKSIPELINDIKFNTLNLIEHIFSIAYYFSTYSKENFDIGSYISENRRETAINHQKHRIGSLLLKILTKLYHNNINQHDCVIDREVANQIRDLFKTSTTEGAKLSKIKPYGVPDFFVEDNNYLNEIIELLKFAVELAIHRQTLSVSWDIANFLGEYWIQTDHIGNRALNKILCITEKAYTKLMRKALEFVDQQTVYLQKSNHSLNHRKFKTIFYGSKQFKKFNTHFKNSVSEAVNKIHRRNCDQEELITIHEQRKNMLVLFYKNTIQSIEQFKDFYDQGEVQENINYFESAIHSIKGQPLLTNRSDSLQIENVEEQSTGVVLQADLAPTNPQNRELSTHMQHLAKILSIYNRNINDLGKDDTLSEDIVSKRYSPLGLKELQSDTLNDINNEFLIPYKGVSEIEDLRRESLVYDFCRFVSPLQGIHWNVYQKFIELYVRLTISIRYLIQSIPEANGERLITEKFIRDNFLKTIKLNKIIYDKLIISEPKDPDSINYDEEYLNVTHSGTDFFIATDNGNEGQFDLILKRKHREQRERIDALQVQLEKNEERLKSLETDKNILVTINENLEMENGDLQVKNGDLETIKGDLQEKNGVLETKNDDLQLENGDLKGACTSLVLENKRLKEEIQQLKDAYAKTGSGSNRFTTPAF